MQVKTMEPDRSIGHEQAVDYWRERSECLEEWICELLRKNQTLRMGLRKDLSAHQHCEKRTVGPSSPAGSNQRPLPAESPSFGTTPAIHIDMSDNPERRMRSTEVRKSVFRNSFIRDFDREASNWSA
jgi:hypothetical protein